MTTRKPSSMSFPDWVDQQIRTAEAAGAFDNLAGTGKPLAGLDRTPHELEWVANYLRRENLEVTGLLPPALALAKEVEDLQVRLLGERSEDSVRAVVAELNGRIDKAYAAPQTGPPLRVRWVDVEDAVQQWRSARDEIAERRAAERARELPAAPPPPRRSGLRRLRRGRVSS